MSERFIPPAKKKRATAHAGAVTIKRVLAAAEKAGLDVAGFEALPDGTVRVFDARIAPKGPTSLFDDLEQAGKL